ncbi:MAG: hypothetical protein LBV67_05070, partial [Streptococcaceae bacterium]|nr:hypothetical protein [Streptococcaceae bacterium]
MKTKIKTLLLTMTLLLGIVLPIVFQVGVVHADIEPDHQHFQFHKVDATDTDPDTQWPYILNDGSLTPYDDIAKGPLGATYLADYKFTAFTITDLFYDLLNGVVEFDWVGPPVPANIYQVKKIISPGSGTAYPGGRSKLYEDLEAFLTQFKTVDEFIAAIPPGTKTTPAIETTATDAVADRSLSAGGVVELPTQTTTYPARNHVYAVFETTTPPGVAVLKSIPMLIMMPIVDGSGKNLELVHVFPKNIVEDGGGKDIISPKVNGYNIGDLISYNLWVTVPDDFTQTINVNGTKVWKYDTITMTDTFGAGLEFVSWDFVWVGNSSDQIPVLPAHDSKVDKLSANITPLVNSIRKDSAPIPAGFEATIDTIGKSPISSPVLITITPDNVNNDPNGSLYTDESMNHRLSLVGKRINVVITFKITDAAIPVAGVLENEITYEFSNEDDPVITGPTGTFPAEDAFVGGYLFAKNSEDSPYEYIEKAEFQIFRSQANANTGDNPLLFFVQTISGTEYYYALNEDEY